MADTYSSALKARKIEQGGYDPAWASRFNADVIDILDAAISGRVSISIGSSTTPSLAALQNGTLSDSHYFWLVFTGTPASAVTLTVPASVTFKQYLIDNQTGQTMTVKYSATAGVAVPTGNKVRVLCDGANVIRAPGNENSGPWTATIRGSGTAGTYQITTQRCRWTRIGRRVWLDVYIVMAAVVTGGGTGHIQITGLPFAKIADSLPIGSVRLDAVDWAAGANVVLSWSTAAASSTLVIDEVNDNASTTDVAIAGLGGANDAIYGSICYETDDA